MRAFLKPSARRGWLLAGLLAPLSATACDLDSSLRALIERSLGAPSVVRYTGTLLLEQNNQRQYLDVDSVAGVTASMRRLSGQPDAPIKPVAASQQRVADACELAVHYEFQGESGPVIAGRATQRIKARPRDSLRFGYVMDVDRETGLPLRVITATLKGQVLERYEFARVSVAGGGDEPPEGVPSSESSHYRLATLPPGFRLVRHLDVPVETLVFSDGFAAASVFVETPSQRLKAGEGAVMRGSTISYSRGMKGTGGSVLITVIGEVPLQTARLLADAVRPFEDPNMAFGTGAD